MSEPKIIHFSEERKLNKKCVYIFLDSNSVVKYVDKTVNTKKRFDSCLRDYHNIQLTEGLNKNNRDFFVEIHECKNISDKEKILIKQHKDTSFNLISGSKEPNARNKNLIPAWVGGTGIKRPTSLAMSKAKTSPKTIKLMEAL